jgi:hypothetical protein
LDYHFATLGADRFQSFCQALLVKRYDKVQCFPTGQPDGGRDASQRYDTDLSDTTVFQVKFSKDPLSKTERQVIDDLIKTENAKVQELVKRGAKQYIFMTNVRGTAHQDSGSIDKINKLLTEAFSIPVFCYWETELSRELDGDSSLKWSYPELIKATDLLEQLVFLHSTGLEQPQRNAIKSFLTTQAKDDAKLKFKQVEIKEDILDLFVDVPAEISVGKRNDADVGQSLRKSTIDRIHAASSVQKTLSVTNQKYDEHSSEQPSAYQILTNASFVSNSKRVVVEGAPGQGKSTITQFLCQVHRLNFLNRTYELGKLNPVYLPKVIALPFRVDIRDYATWLSGFDPFVVTEGPRPSGASDALESFLAWMVAQTTGSSFTADHLNVFFSQARLLIVLDGFDEVAEIEIREQIVEQVSKATERLESLCIDFQVIVTSRPAAFANSPGFPRDEWTYVQLQSLTKGVINQYANQWLGGGIKDEKDKSQILAVLNEKLSQPHIRDLARNPMQLAILLSLISVQGASLPDQRTALYDRYIDIFLNRESEKSDTVRDNRATLIEIHQYLAWKLHSESETKGERKTLAGSISKTDLLKTISAFLESRGHDQAIVNELFTGLVERVVALVSRTQDTFEFEVQPLREYFAARWLYATSPYSPPGRTVKGTKIERFDAISRNFYWQNVARFMAGCYDIGELASLEESVTNLAQDQSYSNISYPAFLGMTLLNDYIFEQQPRLADRLVSQLITTSSFERLLERDLQASRNQILDITVKSGRTRILDHLKSRVSEANLNSRENFRFGRQLRSLLSNDEAIAYWTEQRHHYPNSNQWLRLGSVLGVYPTLPDDELLKLYEDTGSGLVPYLKMANRLDFIDEHPKIWEEVLEHDLRTGFGHFGIYSSVRNINMPSTTVSAPQVVRYILGFIENLVHISFDPDEDFSSSCLRDIFSQYEALEVFEDVSQLRTNHPDLVDLYDLIETSLSQTATTFFADLVLLDEVFSKALEIWGVNWFILSKALYLADKLDFHGLSEQDVFDVTKLVSFTIGLKHGDRSVDEWNALLSNGDAENPDVTVFLMSAMCSWAPDRTVFDNNCLLLPNIDNLPETEANRLSVIERRSRRAQIDVISSDFPDGILNSCKKLSERVFCTLLSRFCRSEIEDKLDEWYNFTSFKDDSALQTLTDFCFDISLRENRDWDRAKLMARACHERNVWFNVMRRADTQANIPDSLAHEVLLEAGTYPSSFVALAERSANEQIGRSMKPIAEIAVAQGWFGADGLPEI